jgi:hypothetical protein
VCTFANFGWHTSFRWSRQFVSESSIYTCDFGVEREFFRNLPSAEIKRKMIVKHSFQRWRLAQKRLSLFFRISTEVLVILNLCVHSQTSADTLLFGGVDNLFLSPAYTLVISVWKGNSSEICHPRKLKGKW